MSLDRMQRSSRYDSDKYDTGESLHENEIDKGAQDGGLDVLTSGGRRVAMEAKTPEIQADWDHDFEILKSVLSRRGYDTSSARSLCELWSFSIQWVTCYYNFEMDQYAGDWVGVQYILRVGIVNSSLPNDFDPEINKLKRVGSLFVQVASGSMPPGIERLDQLSSLKLIGAAGGFEGGLPPGFWNFRARSFAMHSHGPSFTGRFEKHLPFCASLDVSLELFDMPSFGGDIEGLQSCVLVQYIRLNNLPKVAGNMWATMLAWGKPVGDRSGLYYRGVDGTEREIAGRNIAVELFDMSLSGAIPFADGSVLNGSDPWQTWCEAANVSFGLRISQDTNGSRLPHGLAACACRLKSFDVRDSRLTGHFPINLSLQYSLWGSDLYNTTDKLSPCTKTFEDGFDEDGLRLTGNTLSGPLPELPRWTTNVWLAGHTGSESIHQHRSGRGPGVDFHFVFISF